MKPCVFSILILAGISLVDPLAGRAADQASVQSTPAQMKSPDAIAARVRYDQSNNAALQQYQRDLDAALKMAMQSGLLEESNTLNAARKQLRPGEWSDFQFTTPSARIATARYLQTIASNKQQYLRDLEASLKSALVRSDLNEANALNAAKKQTEAELQTLPASGGMSTAVMGNVETGLLLTIGGEPRVWRNKKVKLPSAKTPVSLSGILLLPPNTTKLGLRTANAYGSERLRFNVDGRTIEFQNENNHRFVTLTVPLATQQVRLQIGKSIAVTEWEWGPLEWSINGGKWREIPPLNFRTK